MGLYSVLTDSAVPEILNHGRTEANFIRVTDTEGRRILLNVRSIVSVREADGPPSNIINEVVSSMMGSMFAPPEKKDETVITIDEEED